MINWTDKRCQIARAVLGKHRALGEAVDEISDRFGEDVTRSSLRHAFIRMGWGPPSDYLMDAEEIAPEVDPEVDPEPVVQEAGRPRKTAGSLEDVQLLVKLTKNKALDLETLCDKMDASPKKVRQVIEAARAQGVDVHLAADKIGVVPRPERAVPEVADTLIPPVVGDTQKVAVISDTHFGSKYCMRDQIRDFIHYAYESGVREILHPGDILDGCYRHGWLELTHSGLEDQAYDACEVLPQLPGLTYHCITGNHDETFWDASGANVGAAIAAHFQDQGRNDIFFYGDRSAYLKVRGAVVELWHPRGGGSYAKSYKVQKHIEGYLHIKPQIVLVGHFHQFCHIFERGVHGILCPTFQGSGSKFSRSLGGAQAQGGLIMSWELTELGMIRNFSLEKRSYFEKEIPVEIHNRIDAIEVEPSVYRPKPSKR